MNIYEDPIEKKMLSSEEFESMSAALLESWLAISKDIGPLPQLRHIPNTLEEEERYNLCIEKAREIMARYYTIENS